jgi:hypothetical protein
MKQKVNMPSIIPSSYFMHPFFKINIINGSADKVTVQELKIYFIKFNEEAILTEFPNEGV